MVTLSPRKKDQIVSGLLDGIFHESDRPLSEEDIADRVDYSLVHVRRVFAAEMGEPIGAFVRRMRLERSAGMLARGEADIAYVAWEARYQTREAFTKAFSAHFECPPTTFRRLNEGAENLLPGYLLFEGRPDELKPQVGIFTSAAAIVTFIYEGPALLGKELPSGEYNWVGNGLETIYRNDSGDISPWAVR